MILLNIFQPGVKDQFTDRSVSMKTIISISDVPEPDIRQAGYPAGYLARPMSRIRPDIKIPAAVSCPFFHTLLTSKLN